MAIRGAMPEPPATSSSAARGDGPGEVAADRAAQLEPVARPGLAGEPGRDLPRSSRSTVSASYGASGGEAIE